MRTTAASAASAPQVRGAADNGPQPAPGSQPSAGLAHLPVGVFATVMGIGGTSLAWRWAVPTLHAPTAIADLLAWTALGVFILVSATYLTKVVRHPAAVRAEWRHPVALAFAPTSSIAVLLLATAFWEILPGLSAVLWWVGAAAQLILTLDVLRVWIADQRFQPQHVHPAWFIPVVGNLVVPLAGVRHAGVEVSWFFFSVGAVYWLALLAVVLNRLFVGGELPSALAPTLAVLIAPPAVGALSWHALGGTAHDPFGQILLNVAFFQALLLLTQVRQLARIPFAFPSWALSFPLAGLAAA
ncbi:MAG: SLAC1 anion channel family protein, partial [Kineosporiaceae bacterium]